MNQILSAFVVLCFLLCAGFLLPAVCRFVAETLFRRSKAQEQKRTTAHNLKVDALKLNGITPEMLEIERTAVELGLIPNPFRPGADDNPNHYFYFRWHGMHIYCPVCKRNNWVAIKDGDSRSFRGMPELELHCLPCHETWTIPNAGFFPGSGRSPLIRSVLPIPGPVPKPKRRTQNL